MGGRRSWISWFRVRGPQSFQATGWNKLCPLWHSLGGFGDASKARGFCLYSYQGQANGSCTQPLCLGHKRSFQLVGAGVSGGAGQLGTVSALVLLPPPLPKCSVGSAESCPVPVYFFIGWKLHLCCSQEAGRSSSSAGIAFSCPGPAWAETKSSNSAEWFMQPKEKPSINLLAKLESFASAQLCQPDPVAPRAISGLWAICCQPLG